MAVVGLGRQQVLHVWCMSDSVGSTCKTNGITPVMKLLIKFKLLR